MAGDDDLNLSMHHLTAVHLRDAFRQVQGQANGTQEPLAQKHLTSVHLNEALQQGNQSPPAVAPTQQPQQISSPGSSGSSQSGK